MKPADREKQTKLRITCYDEFNPLPAKSQDMKEKIKIFNNQSVVAPACSKPIYAKNEIEVGRVKGMIANYSSKQSLYNNSLYSTDKCCSLPRLDIPDIFRGLQETFHSKDPIFEHHSDEFDKSKIYEEFERYDHFHRSVLKNSKVVAREPVTKQKHLNQPSPKKENVGQTISNQSTFNQEYPMMKKVC